MNDKLKLFGRRIAELRNQKNLTQEQLAELINYSTNHISKLELARTNPSFDLIVKIAKALDIEPKELFEFDNRKNSRNKYINKINLTLKTLNDKQLSFIFNTILNMKDLQ